MSRQTKQFLVLLVIALIGCTSAPQAKVRITIAKTFSPMPYAFSDSLAVPFSSIMGGRIAAITVTYADQRYFKNESQMRRCLQGSIISPAGFALPALNRLPDLNSRPGLVATVRYRSGKDGELIVPMAETMGQEGKKLGLLYDYFFRDDNGKWWRLCQSTDLPAPKSRPHSYFIKVTVARPNAVLTTAPGPDARTLITFGDLTAGRLRAFHVTWANRKFFKSNEHIRQSLMDLLKSPHTEVFPDYLWQQGERVYPDLIATVNHNSGRNGLLVMWLSSWQHWAYIDENGSCWWGD